jgi:predicted TIM-barrel fold metal-dependent hydrolase
LASTHEEEQMYEKDGKQYFIFDGHLHFWDASPANWKPGAEEYAKGWIECFHAYHGLGPADTHWSLEKFQKYSVEDFERDVFVSAGTDCGVLQSTYLKEWYTNGFNDIERNAALLERFPGKLIVNGRFDPREGQASMEQLEADHEKYGLKGVKLYTAEWYQGSRGWKMTDDAAKPFFDKLVELGIRNVHIHKGPTIWPLDKDAFDVADVDHVATDYNGELNFIVEHVGLPRIEDFCFMATQEPNVYAGLAVVLGGLMHARPNFFNKVMGELLFWVGEDKILYGSDYGIWEPKWQIDGLLEWEMPDRPEYTDYPRLDEAGKRKILGLNGAKLYGVEVPEALRGPVPAEAPASPESAVGVAG